MGIRNMTNHHWVRFLRDNGHHALRVRDSPQNRGDLPHRKHGLRISIFRSGFGGLTFAESTCFIVAVIGYVSAERLSRSYWRCGGFEMNL